jgi:hypothetical protein
MRVDDVVTDLEGALNRCLQLQLGKSAVLLYLLC